MFFQLVRIVLIFCIAGLLFLCASSTSNIGSVSHPAETGLLIPSAYAPERPSHSWCPLPYFPRLSEVGSNLLLVPT